MAQRGEETGNGGAITVYFNLMSTRFRVREHTERAVRIGGIGARIGGRPV